MPKSIYFYLKGNSTDDIPSERVGLYDIVFLHQATAQSTLQHLLYLPVIIDIARWKFAKYYIHFAQK